MPLSNDNNVYAVLSLVAKADRMEWRKVSFLCHLGFLNQSGYKINILRCFSLRKDIPPYVVMNYY